jgi:MFS family permease
MLILMASVYTFGTGAFTTLFPVFGKRMLSLGPVEVGYLWSCLGIGLLVASLGLVSMTAWKIRSRIKAVSVSTVIAGAALCGLVWTDDLTVAALLVAIIGIGFGTWTPIAWGLIQEVSPADRVGRVMAIYTAIATATSMAGMTFFRWMTGQFNEYTSVIGIACVLFTLGMAAAWFSVQVAEPDDCADETGR